MPVNPSPQRQRILTFPTPNVNDILFFETEYANLIGKDVPEYGSKHPDFRKWPDHRLVFIETPDEQNTLYRFYYAADQTDQDDDNWSFVQADIGGSKFDAVQRDYVIRRSEFDPAALDMGSPMPDVPTGKFNGTYVLAERQQIPIDNKILNSLYVVERRTYVKKVPLYQLDYDEYFNKTNYTKQILLYATENPPSSTTDIASLTQDSDNVYWKLSATGILRVSRQLSDNWYLLTEQQVVNTDESGNAGFSYDTFVNYYWPPVLQDVKFDIWELRSGGNRIQPRTIYSKGEYRGPCRARVEVSWSATAVTPVEPDTPPLPERINISTPFFSLNIPPTLHAAGAWSGTNGTDDETYKYNPWTFTKAATNLTDWPTSLLVSSEQKPFRGGFLLEKLTVYSPT